MFVSFSTETRLCISKFKFDFFIFPVPGIDDVLEFQATIKSMNIMGMNIEDFNSIFRIVSATLLFGSMQFKQERNSDQATLPDNTVAQKIAHLLGKYDLPTSRCV